MRILVVSNGFPPRGSLGTEFYTRELVHGLARRGHRLTVLHPERGGALPRYSLERRVEEGVALALLHNPGDPRKDFESSYRDVQVERVFDRLLSQERPDLVHFNYLLWGLSLGLPGIARARGIRSVLTLTDYGLLCHRGQMFDHRLVRCFGPHPAATCARCIREPAPFDLAPGALRLRRAAVRLLAPLGGLGRVVVARDVEARERAVRALWPALDGVVAPTCALGEVFVRAGLPREKLCVLPYAFEEQPYRELRAVPGPARVRFGFLGQFAPHKGLATLLAAVDRLAAREAGDWELVLHGVPSAGRHRLYARELLSVPRPRVRVEPPFAAGEAAGVLAGLSALVAPSEWDENAPLAVLQARAAGVPVIASDVPGIAEIVRDGVHGRLVPPGDPEALAGALSSILRGELRRPLAPGLPMSLEEHLDRLEALYNEAPRP